MRRTLLITFYSYKTGGAGLRNSASPAPSMFGPKLCNVKDAGAHAVFLLPLVYVREVEGELLFLLPVLLHPFPLPSWTLTGIPSHEYSSWPCLSTSCCCWAVISAIGGDYTFSWFFCRGVSSTFPPGSLLGTSVFLLFSCSSVVSVALPSPGIVNILISRLGCLPGSGPLVFFVPLDRLDALCLRSSSVGGYANS